MSGKLRDSRREAGVGRVLRADLDAIQPLYPPTRVLRRQLTGIDEALREAQAAEKAAREKAERIVRRAEKEADIIRAQAEDAGRQAGGAMFVEMIRKAEVEFRRAQTQVESEAKNAALLLAERIMQRQIALAPETIAELTRAVLERLQPYGPLRIVLNPEDYAIVEAQREELLKSLAHADELHFRSDSELPRGSLRVETPMGTYDGSVEAQFRELRRRAEDSVGLDDPHRKDAGDAE